MCEDLIKEIDVDATFLSKVIFSDESIFHLEGAVNRMGSGTPLRDHPEKSYQSENKCVGGHFY